ncbi:MAG: glycosyl hydrolase [Leeuwenhoekiella sp.]
MNAQTSNKVPEATSGDQVTEALDKKQQMAENSLVKNIPFRNIGPTIMSGRVVDLEVNPNDPTEFYVAYASGGLWHTTNNGTSFTPIMDNAPTQNTGDIAMHWPSGTLYLGTGENNASRSSYAGIGILKTTDNGETWDNVGLEDSHHIGSVVVNPENAEEVVVGVAGHLYSPNKNRGIYKSSDGGQTWEQTLFINDSTGIINVVAAPDNFKTLYASAWEKDRKAWDFKGSGSGSVIYKSIDGGSSWNLITTAESGFPTGEGVGRIGLAAFDDQVVYAVHDNQFRREEEEKAQTEIDTYAKDDFKDMTTAAFLKLDDKKLEGFLREKRFQRKYTAQSVKQMVREDKLKPIDVATYLEDANSELFDTPVTGAEVYRSEDGGQTWTKMNTDFIEDVFYSYGYYFAWIRVDPSDKEKIYIGGVPIVKSADGGKTWENISAENVHADHHALWINPNDPGHLINGNDGGVNISYDDGATWIKNNSPAVGQFYAIAVDNQKPYHVYGGLQDNGVWMAPHTARENRAWQQRGEYPWKGIMGGDGMQIQVDSRNPNTVYTGYQFGSYSRLDLKNEKQTSIQPKHELGESPYRFNWQTPILLSPHNQDILYFGGNKLMRSMNQGDDWEPISGDLTAGGEKGNVPYGTLATISESPFHFGLIYTGSDDGLVQYTKNGGADWLNITSGLPQNLWVSRVVASKHKKERVYVTLNGYRWDDFTPYVFMSENFGESWKDISGNLPVGAVNVIAEDPKKENMLYLGTDDALYVSMDQGTTWQLMDGDMPAVAVHDLVVQPEANDLVVGTHGRSIYIADVSQLQEMDLASAKMQLSKLEPVRYSERWGEKWSTWSEAYDPEVELVYFSPTKETVTITIMNEKGKELQQMQTVADHGLNYYSYDLTVSEKGKKILDKETKKDKGESDDASKKPYLIPGTYTVKISGAGLEATQKLEIESSERS